MSMENIASVALAAVVLAGIILPLVMIACLLIIDRKMREQRDEMTRRYEEIDRKVNRWGH